MSHLKQGRINVEALTEIAEWLEAGAPHRNGVHSFDMNEGISWKNTQCNTVCCIAGATLAL